MKNRENKNSLLKTTSGVLGAVMILIALGVPAVLAEQTRTGDTKSFDDISILSGLSTADLNSGLTPTDLANSLLGGGVTISNVQFNGVNIAAGKFSGGTGIIGVEGGIILSSGNIGNVKGPNQYSGTTSDNGQPGDANLNSLIPGYTTLDAAVLEFDFVPTTSFLTFNYVFGSEEYNEWVGSSYNDVFGFFVNGQNIALIPGTTTPVSINNVNLGINSAYYINNAFYPGPLNTELDGLTKVIQAKVTNLVPGQTYHIKLAVADAGDRILDSDVFIQAESFISLKLSLTPTTDSNPAGTTHTLTAKLVDNNGNGVPGKTITFTVSAGPNAGLTGTGVTDAAGYATWSYTGTNAGTDTIVATGEGETSNAASKTWIQTNKPPVANPGGPYVGNEGSQITFNGLASYDPDAGDSIVKYEWDLDGDNVFEANGAIVSKTWSDDYSGTVTLKVTDTKGATNTKSTTVTVKNVAPTVNAGSDATINEGSTFSSSGSFSDPGADTWTATVDYGDGSGVQPLALNPDKTFALNHVYADNGVYTVTVTVKDDDLGTGSDTAIVTVNNVAPAVNAGSDATIDEGSAFSGSGSFSDPGADTWTATVDYGDGSSTQPLALNLDKTFALNHVYADNGVYTVTVTVKDDDLGTGSDTAIVTVKNVAPTVGPITAPVDPTAVGTAITATASFTDPGTADTHTAIWNWGDGTSTGTVTETSGSGSVTDSHTYTTPGIYTVTLTVTDDDGGVGSSEYRYVVVYDPDGGFVTGGGWINSPAGAYAADASLVGKANFGFVSKYLKGANVPTGVTEFQFKAGNLNFHSKNYEWLVVAGARAQYKGTGTINGAGEYGFMLTAIDGQINGGGGVDKFRIKIWDKAADTVVYDNVLGASDNVDAASLLAISGGSIVIHNK